MAAAEVRCEKGLRSFQFKGFTKMKKRQIALVVMSALAGVSHAQTAVQVYGIVDAGVAHTTKQAAPVAGAPTATASRTGIDSGLLQASRFGVRGTEDVGGGLKAQFALEGGIAIDNGTSTQGGALFGRRSIVGLVGDGFGNLQIGRRKDFTDEVAEPYSSITPFGTFITRVHANNLDRIGGNRANNMIYYSTPTFGGFRANISYGFGETAGSTSIGESLGFGANYGNGPFGIGFGYWQSKLGTVTATANSSSDQGATSGAGCNTVGLGTPGDTCLKTWIVGSRYKLGNFMFRGTYSQVKQPLVTGTGPAAPTFATAFTRTAGSGAFTPGGSNNSDASIVDVGVDYTTAGAWKLKSSYIQSRYDFTGAAPDGKLDQLTLGAEYYLSKRTTLYGTVAHMRASRMYSPGILGGSPGAENSTSAVGVGVRHYF
ncbi:porin [Herbaspirillum sp. GCM10030257]|uniref:porin n=1 Tax=Herbaspirillum sp. GCM10030257 TaxID=3273393 RepID=UPI00361D51A8